jgi:hypothetical protein
VTQEYSVDVRESESQDAPARKAPAHVENSGFDASRNMPCFSRRAARVAGFRPGPRHDLLRLIMMRKFAIASLLVAGVALSGSVLAQNAAPPAAPATKPAPAQPASSSSSKHHKKSHKPTQISGQPGTAKGGKSSGKKSGKATLPPVTTGPST